MVGEDDGCWTMPGGGIEPGESAAQAAIREAWEESGARVALTGAGVEVTSPYSGAVETLFPACLLSLDASPERRPRRWVNPQAPDWREDYQVAVMLRVLELP